MGKQLFNPEKITTLYSLLAAFLVIVEASLGTWLIMSNSTTEKVIAGILITVIFLSFLYALYKIKIEKIENNKLNVEGIGVITPADNPVIQSSLEDKIQDIYISHDRSYILQKPAQSWTIEELKFSDWVSQGMAVDDTQLINKIIGERIEIDKILVIRSKAENYLYPIPGETIIDGRDIPTALSVPTFLRLSILPLTRRQAPLFIERPFIHNYNLVLSGLLNMNVTSQIKEDIISKNNSTRIISVFRQRIENVYYENKKYDEISSYHTLVGIEGSNKDYVLILQYITTSQELEGLQIELKELQDLINSFQPIKNIDSQKEKFEFDKKADEEFKYFIDNKKADIFFQEFLIALMRIKDCNLDSNEDRGKLIKTLQPFKALSEILGISYPELGDLWKAIEDCEKGNAAALKNIFPNILQGALLKDSEVKEIK